MHTIRYDAHINYVWEQDKQMHVPVYKYIINIVHFNISFKID